MPKDTSKSSAGTPSPAHKRGGKRTKDPVPSSIDDLRNASTKSKHDHGKSAKTRKTYDGALVRVRAWLKVLCEKRVELKRKRELPADKTIDDALLKAALGDTPNKHSSLVCELFLVEKCINENHPKSADSYCSALIDYWDNLDAHGKYKGAYDYDENTGKVRGNPARAPSVQTLLKSIKNGLGGDKTTRNHAEAISYNDMVKWMTWSETVVPTAHAYWTDWVSISSQQRLLEVTQHLMMRGFAASGFTLWTRNSELCQLRRRHIKWDCHTQCEFGGLSYDEVNLIERKGWQSKGEDALNGNIYEIYGQPETPAIDMRPRLRTWVHFYETVLLKRPLGPDEFIFPYIAPNGTIHAHQSMSYQTSLTMINEFSQKAGLPRTFTTHSFRRGGAQYRFMHAGFGKCWSLDRVQWWGGWANNEDVGTMVRYLLDELRRYEKSHCDALRPVQHNRTGIFLGHHEDIAPASQGQVKALATMLEHGITRIQDVIAMGGGSSQHFHATALGSFPSAHHHSSLPPGSNPMGTTSNTRSHGNQHPHPQISTFATGTPNSQNTSLRAWTPTDQTPAGAALYGVIRYKPSTQARKEKHGKGAYSAPSLPGRIIPNISSRIEHNWRLAVKQWNEGDSEKGIIPLKDWPVAWYTGKEGRTYGVKRNQRKLVAEAFHRCDSNEELFLKRYPMAAKGFSTLVKALQNESPGRCSKNGTREERDRRNVEEERSDSDNGSEIATERK